jgi:acyl carrier protein
MEINDFVKHFAEQFEDTDPSVFSAETKYKDLDEWSSLVSLSIIAMVDDQYKVRIKGEDIRRCSTVGDLYCLVEEKMH